MTWPNVIPWIISAGMFVLALITLVRNGKKDYRQEYAEESSKITEIEKSLSSVNAKLEQLCTTSVETRADIKAMNKNWLEVEKRVTKIETQLESVWKRIDELKDKIVHYHEE